MRTPDETALKNAVIKQLEESFGQLVQPSVPGEPIKVSFPGSRYLALVDPRVDERDALITVVCPVTHSADWTPALAEFLLQEAGSYIFGRLERCGDGITIEHSLAAGSPREEVGRVVRVLAHTAVLLERDLALMGALATPEVDDLE